MMTFTVNLKSVQLMKFFLASLLLAWVSCIRAHEDDGHSGDGLTVTGFRAVPLSSVALPSAVSDLTSTRLGNTVYLAGGCNATNGNTLETYGFSCLDVTDDFLAFDVQYDQSEGSETRGRRLSTLVEDSDITYSIRRLTRLPTRRYRHAAVAVGSNIVLLGGRTVTDGSLINQVDIYNVDDDTWITLPDLPEAYQTSDHTGFNDGGLNPDMAYFVGGWNTADYQATGNFFRLNVTASIATNSFIIEELASLNEARGDIASVLVSNVPHVGDESHVHMHSVAIVSGGFTHLNNYCTPLASTEAYDFHNDRWQVLGEMNLARADKVLVSLEGSVYAVGGERQVEDYCNISNTFPEVGELTVAVNDIEVLSEFVVDDSNGIVDAVSNDTKPTWRILEDLEFHRFRFSSAAFDEIHRFYTFGGQGQYDSSCECFRTTNEVVMYDEVFESDVEVAEQTSGSVVQSTAAVFCHLAAFFGVLGLGSVVFM